MTDKLIAPVCPHCGSDDDTCMWWETQDGDDAPCGAQQHDETVEDWNFEIIQGGVVVAMGSGPDRERVEREAAHYAAQYAQDGPLTVRVWGPVTLTFCPNKNQNEETADD